MSIQRAEVDGVPTFWMDEPGPMVASLVFRVGRPVLDARHAKLGLYLVGVVEVHQVGDLRSVARRPV